MNFWTKCSFRQKDELLREAKKYGRDLRFSRKSTGEVVTISKGEMAKLHANYAGDKVLKSEKIA